MESNIKSFRIVTSRTLAIISLIVGVLVILFVWLSGLGQNRSLFDNSVISTSILAIAFFLFVSIGLYRGIQLEDNVGRLTDHIKKSRPGFLNIKSISEFISPADGIEGVIVGVLLWIFMAIICAFLLWLFGAVLWFGIVIFAAMLYWIFFRALNMVFRNSGSCKGKLAKSIFYGFIYTSLYVAWIYIIIFAADYFAK